MCRQARETYILSKRKTEEGEDPPPHTHTHTELVTFVTVL